MPDRASIFWDPRLGRGPLLVGSGMILVGFLMPMVRSRGVVASAIEIAIDGAINLWLVPAVAIGMLAILAWRRDAASMRASRLGLFALAVGGAMPLLYTTRRIAIMSSKEGTEPSWLVGAWVMSAGLLLCAAWSARVGTSSWLRRGSSGPG